MTQKKQKRGHERNGNTGSVKVADRDSWTGRHIQSLLRLYKRETEVPGAKQNRSLIAKIEKLIAYLYRRGRDGRGRRRKHREPTEPQDEGVAAVATQGPAAEEDV